MSKRTFLLAAATAFMALMATFLATPSRALAQQNLNCCDYSVEITGIKPECLPIKLKTQWMPGFTDIITYGANGVYWNHIPAPCPLAPKFDWVSPDLGVTQIHLGETRKVVIGGCCYKITATLNPNFCILIKIDPC